MNKDYIVLSIQGQRLSTIPEEKLQDILARIGSIIVFNIGVEPENVEATILTEEELVKTSIANTIKVKQDEEKQIAEKAAVIYICEKFINDRKFDRYKFITSLIKSNLSQDDKALLNAVTIIANPSMEYEDFVDKCGEGIVVKYGFTRPVYQQVKMAYSLII
jgi:hypothetical protein|nr:MAG TPA: hypothetical protein [Crassvirales sp.]